METVLAALIREQRKSGIEADVYFYVDQGGAGHYDGVCRVMFPRTDLLLEVLLREHYDVLHVTTYVAPRVQRAVSRAFYRGAIVVTCHGFGAYERELRSDRVTAVSGAVADSIQPHYSKPVSVVYNGVDTSRFGPPAQREGGKPIMAWVGRSGDGVKDYAGLTATALSSIAGDFHVVVVDGSPEGAECGNWLPGDATVIRRKPWDQMPEFYRSVAASGGFLLCTSRMEACPMNILEAQACGCPVIAPAVGGIPEIVKDKVTGCLYGLDGGIDAVTEAITWLYSGANYDMAQAHAVEHIGANHTVQRMCGDFTAIYEEVVKQRKPSIPARIARSALRVAIPGIRAVRRYRNWNTRT